MSLNAITEKANSVCSNISENFKDIQMLSTANKLVRAFAIFSMAAASAVCFTFASSLALTFATPYLATIMQVVGGIAGTIALGIPACNLLASRKQKELVHQAEIEKSPLEDATVDLEAEKEPVQPVQPRTLAQIAYDNRYLILAGVVLTAATIAGVKLGREGIKQLPGQAKEFAVNLPTNTKHFVVNLPTNTKHFVVNLPTNAKKLGTDALEAGKKAPGQALALGKSAVEAGKKAPGQALALGKSTVEAGKKAPGQALALGKSAVEAGKKVPGQALALGKSAVEAGKKAPGQALALGKSVVEAGKKIPGNTLAFGKDMLSKISFKK